MLHHIVMQNSVVQSDSFGVMDSGRRVLPGQAPVPGQTPVPVPGQVPVSSLAEASLLRTKAVPTESVWSANGYAIGDRLAIVLSGLCLAHCVASTIFLVSVGSILLNPLFHEIGLIAAFAIGSITLVRGLVTHGFLLPFAVGCFGLAVMSGALLLPHGQSGSVVTIIGVLIVALAHDLNFRASR